MRRLFLLVFGALVAGLLHGQDITGTWIRREVREADQGSSVTTEFYSCHFFSYTFLGNKVYTGTGAMDKREAFNYTMEDGYLRITTSSGIPVNEFLVESISGDEMVLQEMYEPYLCSRFLREDAFLETEPVQLEVAYVEGADTVYRANRQVRPVFGLEEDFQAYCLRKIPEVKRVNTKDCAFVAEFTVRENGTIDRVHVVETINDRFEKQFFKLLEKSSGYWNPGKLDGALIDMQVCVEMRFLSSDTFESLFAMEFRMRDAILAQDYSLAVRLCDDILEVNPGDMNTLLYRTLCEIEMGDHSRVCESLLRIRTSERFLVGRWVEKYCK